MSTLSISQPEPMKIFVDAEVAAGGYDTTSNYLSALIREAQERKANALRRAKTYLTLHCHKSTKSACADSMRTYKLERLFS